ncbi:MAG: hypothetical protein H0V88_05635 [Pyrinomonadaceae bacterium]|nr:hypothetical protein [Pyrinomonadaceae bacterium]
MKRFAKSTLFFLVAVCFAWSAFFTDSFAQRRRSAGGGGSAQRVAENVTGDTFEYSAETPRGAHIRSVSRPRAEALRAIDDGLARLFAIARKNNYRARTNYFDYTIFIARPDRTQNGQGGYSPDIAVGAGQYGGSRYDQGGYVYAAGMVISLEPCAFVIAEHNRNWNRVSDAVRFEGEHLVLYHNDRARFQATLDHSRGGGGHPILK